jgi:hypothetical protein
MFDRICIFTLKINYHVLRMATGHATRDLTSASPHQKILSLSDPLVTHYIACNEMRSWIPGFSERYLKTNALNGTR